MFSRHLLGHLQDRLVARPVHTQDITTQKNAYIHASSGIRNHDPKDRMGKTHVLYTSATVILYVNLRRKYMVRF
jgi:hypothetical protein